MSENDYIAEYVKENHPEIITSFNFGLWKAQKILNNSLQRMVENLKTIDFSGLNKALEDMKKQQEGEE